MIITGVKRNQGVLGYKKENNSFGLWVKKIMRRATLA
jgi:hypothetical protein